MSLQTLILLTILSALYEEAVACSTYPCYNTGHYYWWSSWYFWLVLIGFLACCCGAIGECYRRSRRNQNTMATVIPPNSVVITGGPGQVPAQPYYINGGYTSQAMQPPPYDPATMDNTKPPAYEDISKYPQVFATDPQSPVANVSGNRPENVNNTNSNVRVTTESTNSTSYPSS